MSVYFYLKINKAKCQNVITAQRQVMVRVNTVQIKDTT